VHFNSGILNKAIVLAIDGGTFQGTTVTAIGRPKAEQIIFRTLMLGVTSTSNLTDMANGAVNSCVQLAQGSQFGITSADCSALSTAFSAVGLPILP
jgi:Zn-dependent metalloprotease